MKKTLFYLLPILLIAAMCVGLASCGDDDDVINIRREENNDKKDENKNNYKYDDTSNPFTIEAIGSGTITFKNRATGCVMYKVNDGAVQSIAAGTNCQIPVSAGQKIMFFGNNATYYHNDEGSNISGTADFYAYGNIMSLITSTGYSTAKTLMGANTFSELFSESTHLKSHSAKPLLLPATTLTEGCYSTMFYNCYNLTTAPELPAKTLARDCYTCMFMGCSKLNYVKCLAEGINGSFDYESYLSCWLEDVSSSGTFIKASNSSWSSYYIPSSWTVINNGEEEPDEEEEQDETYPDIQSTPLTLEAISDGTITFKNKAAGSVIYKIDGGETQTIKTNTNKTINVIVGQKVRFWGNNATYCPNNESSNISSTAECYVYGNIRSLINSNNFATNTTLTKDRTFEYLFSNNANLKSNPSKPLVLPAISLSEKCYQYLFSNCTGLTVAPELPATTLAVRCYFAMFTGCTGLTVAPKLPATTLAEGCYANIFSRCTGLTDAPKLPATTLAKGCYTYMFNECANLKTAPALPATTLAERCYSCMFAECTNLKTASALPAKNLAKECYQSMFWNCTSLTVAPSLPATTLIDYCYSQMFYRCRSLVTAPTLPATMLVSNCYYRMFYGCTNLNYVKCMAEDISANNCTKEWLKNVAAEGTFEAVIGTDWSDGPSGTPMGWTTSYELW